MERRFANAEKAMETISEKRFSDGEFKKGYIHALEGILLSKRTGDDRDFFNRELFDKESKKRYRKSFQEFIKKGVRSQFDIGYFMAWSDMVQYLLDNDEEP
ncbi:MAG: hypothetical protein PVJ38_08025 [Candidatus Bathyarchaeota archaeon]|jgi:hypothetical protein